MLLHGFGQSWFELCRMSYAICMVLVSRGYNFEGCPMPIAWFWRVVVDLVSRRWPVVQVQLGQQ